MASGGIGTGGGIGGGSTGGVGTGGNGAGTGGAGGKGQGGAAGHVGFYVDGRVLRDKCGEKVVLRGINEMLVYTTAMDGTPYLAEMAKTGANSVRITWNTTGSAAKLDAVMKNTIASQMIPMVVLNDATGDLSKLGAEVDYWVKADVVAAIKKYEDKTLINIGNEVGDGKVTQSAFTTAYTDAITRMRTAGIHTPLVIDGSSWGQDIDMLQATGPGLLTADPDHNLIFSVHMYWNDANGTRVMSEISQSVTANLPLIVGEFAQHAVSGCSSAPFAYKTLLSVAKTSEIGFLPWSWGGVTNCKADQPFDMTTDGTFATLQGWGKEVAVTDPNSIMATSVRSHYMTAGSCL
jgi:mannan endo-1,4-beta-mannosidase